MQNEKSFIYLALPLVMATGIISAFTIWLLSGLAGLVDSACLFFDYCHSLLTRCMEYYGLVPSVLFWAGGLVVAAGAVNGLARAASGLVSSHRSLKRLPLKPLNGTSLVLIDDPSLRTAFTSGLMQPKIYISKGLINHLEGPELRAVFLHELHHMRRRDPLKFFLVGLMRDTFFYIPAASYLERYLSWKKEHEADGAVLHSTGDPLSLAAALVKVSCPSVAAPVAPAAGKKGLTAGRIRALVEGEGPAFDPPGIRNTAMSVAAAGILTVSLLFPLWTGARSCGISGKGQCSGVQKTVASTCATHCRPSKASGLKFNKTGHA